MKKIIKEILDYLSGKYTYGKVEKVRPWSEAKNWEELKKQGIAREIKYDQR